MTVYFIGAGPGASDLITVRGLRVIERCPVCLYAGSLVPFELIASAPKGARIINTASMILEEIIAEIQKAHKKEVDVARVHSGDPSIYSATAEQMRCLKNLEIPFEVIPGVPAFTAAAASLKSELTLPEISQTIIVTRTAMNASCMPEEESLSKLGQSKATLAIHLSIRNLQNIQRELIPHYGKDCPVIVIYRATWPDEQIIRGTLQDISQKVRENKIRRTALILVGHVFKERAEFCNSSLYDASHQHVFRHKTS
ncbi:MAG: Precorrin-4 C(11)-methyltransferase [Hyphomicrobiaceae bacterium hypho_1]